MERGGTKVSTAAGATAIITGCAQGQMSNLSLTSVERPSNRSRIVVVTTALGMYISIGCTDA